MTLCTCSQQQLHLFVLEPHIFLWKTREKQEKPQQDYYGEGV